MIEIMLIGILGVFATGQVACPDYTQIQNNAAYNRELLKQALASKAELQAALDKILAAIETVKPQPVPSVTPSASPSPAAHVPTGIQGSFTPLIDATFGTNLPDSTVKTRADLDKLAYYWFIYGPADTDGKFWAQPDTVSGCSGPTGDGTDGLYGNFYSRFMHCLPNSAWDRHVLSGDRLVLKASCGVQDNNPANCADANIGAGMLRFVKSFRPTAKNPIVVELKGKNPKGMYSWPAFWLNPGEQAPRAANGSPGKVLSSAWPPEIDLFDNYGFNNQIPGHALVMATPSGGNDAKYASPLCQSQGLAICDLPIAPGGALLAETSVASFAISGWYATTKFDMASDFHVYTAKVFPDHIDSYLDGVLYRSRGYLWPESSPPMHLLLSNQTGAKFNDISAIKDQGGIAGGWDWSLAYVRVWQQN